ncbi:putative uncharacterized protein [Streptomyces azureus]|uniref:Uncharacterized protein n=1 Tax=Streptomyces azureus TaxID=146537 RepID=A0A0K8PK48_STRAJ|nr:putative uncharacterized protein [Streptomyces azureus]
MTTRRTYAVTALADEADMGEPSDRPATSPRRSTVTRSEDCPALAIGYIREPDRIEMRYVGPARAAAFPAEAQAQGQDQAQASDQGQGQDQGRHESADPAVEAAAIAREVVDVRQRITHWLRHKCPDSHATLRAGVGPTAITADPSCLLQRG